MWVPQWRTETVSGLRMRYVPRSRLGQGLVSLAPWLNLVLLIAFVLLLKGNYIVEPGVVVELPRTPMRDGSAPRLVAIVLSLETETPGVREEIVVFNDQRFRLDDAEHQERLKSAIAAEAQRRKTGTLVLEADRHVEHGTLVSLYGMAREIGLDEVDLAAQPPLKDAARGQER